MYIRSLIILPLALVGFAAPAEAALKRDIKQLDLSQAEQQIGRGGPELRALFNGSEVGILFGGRGVGYVTETLYMGGAGYGGLFTKGAGASAGIGYGGLLVGAEGNFSGPFGYDASLLIGGAGGGGSIANVNGGGLALEPTIAFTQKLGGGAHGVLSLGYLYAPAASGLSGATIGLRLDFKRLTLTLPLED